MGKGQGDGRALLAGIVAAIRAFDEVEAQHQVEVLEWLASDAEVYRTAKPATPPKHLVSYSVLVDRVRRSVLLVDHRDAGLWLPTGGHVDVGEDPADAAIRELNEELGLHAPFASEAERAPLFLTQTVTGGLSVGHTDVSLWYVFEGFEDDELHPDQREFAGVQWWPVGEIRHSDGTRFDPYLPRFVAKLADDWATAGA